MTRGAFSLFYKLGKLPSHVSQGTIGHIGLASTYINAFNMSQSPLDSEYSSPPDKSASNSSPDATKPAGAKRGRWRRGECESKISHPNAFVSLPITSDRVKEKLTSVQKAILDNDGTVNSMKVSPATFHLTLLVINIHIGEQKDVAQKALDKCVEEISPILAGVDFKFALDKLSSFGRNVVFITMRDEEELTAFKEAADRIRSIFTEHGLPSTEERKAFPHVALFKGRRGIAPGTYQSIEDTDCGVETFQTLQLCSMNLRKQPSGYYHVICDRELNLDP